MIQNILLHLMQIFVFAIADLFPNNRLLLQIQKHLFLRALFDNIIHGITAFLCMLIYCMLIDQKYLQEYFRVRIIIIWPILSGILACLIDVDHFIAAKSFSLKAATSLTQRPILHCTSLMVPIPVIILITNYFIRNDFLNKLGFCLLITIITHHFRDALRRGLYLNPFQPTLREQPISFHYYLAIVLTIPYFCYSVTLKNVRKPSDSNII